MTFSRHNIDLENFNKEKNFKYFHFTNDEKWKINVFFAISDKVNIENRWRDFSNTIASIFQNSDYMTSNKDFQKWNFYIIYISPDTLSKDLKNRIENDKFSSRKIIEDNYLNDFNDEEANRLIIKHITHSDLIDIVKNTSTSETTQYEPVDKQLWGLLDNEENILGKVDKQDEIINKLKDEN